MIVDGCGSASSIRSFTAVTVTVCTVLQFNEVKISDVGLTVVCASGVMVIVTFEVGSLVSVTS